jgi:1,4-alpha-glucan branching enzyme
VDFVLALHTHLPYVLNHGRWPHGSDWLCEAVIDTYIPLIEALDGLEHEGTPTPVTIGVTPVLANQLASPDLPGELAAFFDQRLQAAHETPNALRGTPDEHLIPLAHFWQDRLIRLRRYYESIGGNIVGALRGFAERGRVELITSAATHGFLPMLGAEASIRLQLDVGRQEYRRLFGGDPQGLWLPECAYRPRGTWRPFNQDADGPTAAASMSTLPTLDIATFSPMHTWRAPARRSDCTRIPRNDTGLSRSSISGRPAIPPTHRTAPIV